MTHPTAWVEFLQNGLSDDHEILDVSAVTNSPTRLPDMMSLAAVGRLQNELNTAKMRKTGATGRAE